MNPKARSKERAFGVSKSTLWLSKDSVAILYVSFNFSGLPLQGGGFAVEYREKECDIWTIQIPRLPRILMT